MKPATEWLNTVGEAVVVALFAGSQPPGAEVEKLIAAIQADARAELLAVLEKIQTHPGLDETGLAVMSYDILCECQRWAEEAIAADRLRTGRKKQ